MLIPANYYISLLRYKLLITVIIYFTHYALHATFCMLLVTHYFALWTISVIAKEEVVVETTAEAPVTEAAAAAAVVVVGSSSSCSSGGGSGSSRSSIVVVAGLLI